MISSPLYAWFNAFSNFLVFWVMFFTGVTTVRIVVNRLKGVEKTGHNAFITELAGFPLVIFQMICFTKAILAKDIISVLLFAWWGPGFWLTALYLVLCKVRNVKPNWYPYRKIISWLCKVNYLLFMGVFWLLGFPSLMYVYSVWIINDQYGMAFLSLDADRLRRTFHDHWFVRILYPLGLFVPFLYPNMMNRFLFEGYGLCLFILWVCGIFYAKKRVDIKQVPTDKALLRNMIYFSKPDIQK